MRLINSVTLQLEEFVTERIPEYAILSHTWGEEEVSFRDMQGTNAKDMKGFVKLRNCCAQAARDGFDYAWVDTCCIDKSSSAELSESINSMYKWYKNAKICYAYLEDIAIPHSIPESQYLEALRPCRWFTRGWTLQELIAPAIVQFYDRNWNIIGSKSSLQEVLSNITGIEMHVLRGGEPWACNVAQRMSWASKRTTKRAEDIAYCLMGLFNVNIPLLYGEGEIRAFNRLQEEIMKGTEDHSLFAWLAQNVQPLWTSRGLLASSPQEFKDPKGDFPRLWQYSELQVGSSANLGSTRDPWDDPHSLTSRGLRISLPLRRKYGEYPQDMEYLACINCRIASKHKLLCVYLQKLPNQDQLYGRVRSHEVTLIGIEEINTFEYSTIYVIQTIPNEIQLYKPQNSLKIAPTNWNTMDNRLWNEPQYKNSGNLTVREESSLIPGLNEFDIATTQNIRVKAYVDPRIDHSFRVHIDTWGDSLLYSAGVSLLPLSSWDRDIQASTWSPHFVTNPRPHQSFQGSITFRRKYPIAPTVIVWLTGFDFERGGDICIHAEASKITATSFEIKIETWSGSLLYWASASWIAYSSDSPRIRSGSYSTMDVRSPEYSQHDDSGRVKFVGQPFPWAPTVLVGLNEFHINGTEGRGVRCTAVTSEEVTGAGFTWRLNSWSDTMKYSAGASYLALDNGPPVVVDDTEQLNDVGKQ